MKSELFVNQTKVWQFTTL